MDILQTVLFGLVVLITHFIEGVTGFGCTRTGSSFLYFTGRNKGSCTCIGGNLPGY